MCSSKLLMALKFENFHKNANKQEKEKCQITAWILRSEAIWRVTEIRAKKNFRAWTRPFRKSGVIFSEIEMITWSIQWFFPVKIWPALLTICMEFNFQTFRWSNNLLTTDSLRYKQQNWKQFKLVSLFESKTSATSDVNNEIYPTLGLKSSQDMYSPTQNINTHYI